MYYPDQPQSEPIPRDTWADIVLDQINIINVQIQKLEAEKQNLIKSCNHTNKNGQSTFKKYHIADILLPDEDYEMCTVCKIRSEL
jgi:hypothetical protein